MGDVMVLIQMLLGFTQACVWPFVFMVSVLYVFRRYVSYDNSGDED